MTTVGRFTLIPVSAPPSSCTGGGSSVMRPSFVPPVASVTFSWLPFDPLSPQPENNTTTASAINAMFAFLRYVLELDNSGTPP